MPFLGLFFIITLYSLEYAGNIYPNMGGRVIKKKREKKRKVSNKYLKEPQKEG
jgi:hypothetical protein